MEKSTYNKIEKYMLTCMNDGAHDEQHIYRVLYAALEIAEEFDIDYEILIASALLHDIGRDAQYKNPELDHAIIGSEMAYDFLLSIDWDKEKCLHVKNCISTHRFRKKFQPESIEAKILFDADKLDVTGTIGIARTLAYKGIVADPLYLVEEGGAISNGIDDLSPSFFYEYHFKLKNLYDKFYTEKAREMAMTRKQSAQSFYESMLNEVNEIHKNGNLKLKSLIY